VTLIPGDGIGPEVTDASRRALEATGIAFQWDVQRVGATAASLDGNPLPSEAVESIRRNRVALKGPVATPLDAPMRSVNIALRRSLGLYAQVRPFRSYAGVASAREDVDLVIIRETTEDLYSGIEFGAKSTPAVELIDWLAQNGHTIASSSGISVKHISEEATRRIFGFAFDYARKNDRKTVACVHKGTVMKCTDGLLLGVGRELAAEHTDMDFVEVSVDNLAMQLVREPRPFDVLVMPNLYGDILSGLAAGLIGSVGLAPGGNYGDDVAIFEPAHGTAPKHAGENRSNPIAMMLSGVMMLRHLGEVNAADRLERTIGTVIREGKSLTYDMKPPGDSNAVGTRELGNAVVSKLQTER
jgi:isocitrate dehydrogenase (NAD+)